MSRMSASYQEKGRITARVPLVVQETIQRAAELTGIPANAYIVQVVHQHAQEFIDRHEMKNIVLSGQDSEWFLEQLARPRSPNAKLKKALTGYQEMFDGDEDSAAFPTSEGTA
ncbi:hypothetical protein FACS1894116_12910 [Betaproteobacteria bacterium]|nr:hypothetical protein AGMMS49543_20660 [Betaproteobacteria bacterium]GHT96194.1 hypothetical protein FACS1894116_12910 [Betaproteobacteria bacterium]GHU00496.1 hypothetical protein FACS1894154_09630 [Betaproteobacteria bacterium]GHU01898.1 hypothetical protein AGMMS49960_13040 [Betaproteobacteria bacterium]GHU10065.1 hypothetical protein AGMMS50225_12550 [Betaproteobacteria bacterium]